MPDRHGIRLIPVLWLALAWPVSGAAQEQSVTPLEQQIELSRQRLERIRDEQRRLEGEMSALSEQIHDVQAELENLNRQATNQEALLREMDHQLAIRDQQVRETTAELFRTQDQLVEKKVLFARRARDLYKRGPLANVHILLAAESFAELINRYQYLYLVALHDRLLVEEIEELRNLLKEKENRLRSELQGLRDVRAAKVEEIQDLYYLERERNRRLQAVRGRQVSAERELEQLRRDEQELTNLVARLEREREAAEALAATAPTAGTLTPAMRGQLDWPVAGRVIYRFGPQRNQDGTTILRNGLGIAAPEHAPVTAVRPGTVVLARPFVSYGPSVILSHGGGYYTLYLYLSELAVREGESVTAGQIIGRVGGGGTPEGTHMEFQLRERGRAIDPIPWMRRGQ